MHYCLGTFFYEMDIYFGVLIFQSFNVSNSWYPSFSFWQLFLAILFFLCFLTPFIFISIGVHPLIVFETNHFSMNILSRSPQHVPLSKRDLAAPAFVVLALPPAGVLASSATSCCGLLRFVTSFLTQTRTHIIANKRKTPRRGFEPPPPPS